MKRLCFFIVLIFCCADCGFPRAFERDKSGAAGRYFLSPRLKINTLVFKKDFPRRIPESDAETMVYPIEFPLHVRPFELFCDLCKVIADEEGILIRFKILTKNGEILYDSVESLDKIAVQMERNNLTVYNQDILPVLERVNETRNGIHRIKEKYYLRLKFEQTPWHDGFSAVEKLKDFFRKFFANEIKRNDGSKLDISFPRETDSRYCLDAADYLELTANLGYNDFPQRQNVRENKHRDNGTHSRNTWKMKMWMLAHTPDYKQTDSAVPQTRFFSVRKADSPAQDRMFDSAV